MKKVLIGILTLVAAVVLTSPAFGALKDIYPGLSYHEVSGVGEFSFDEGITVLAAHVVNLPAGPEFVIDQMESWGSPWAEVEDFTFSQKFDNESGLVGIVNFDTPVQIVVAKWGQGQSLVGSYAFLLSDYTTHFDWNLYGKNEMSHVEGYNAVPVPAAAWLLGSGVLGLVAIRRRRS
jgi:hypothetical protein